MGAVVECSCSRVRAPTGGAWRLKRCFRSMHGICFSLFIAASVSSTVRASSILGLPHATGHFHGIPCGDLRKKNLDFQPYLVGRVPVKRRRPAQGWK
jgi:hypothetical protein